MGATPQTDLDVRVLSKYEHYLHKAFKIPLLPLEVYFFLKEFNYYHAELKHASTLIFITEPKLTIEFICPSVSLFKTDFKFEE